VIDGSGVSMALAFGAGIASFLSPCVLPLVPSYLTFVTGMSLDELATTDAGNTGNAARRRTMMHATLFVLGFTLVFVSLGAAATALGGAMQHWLRAAERIGGAVIVLFGLYLLGVLRLPFLMRERRVHLGSRPEGLAGSVLAGVAFGAGWTPCVGPVLATILLYAGTSTSAVHGTVLLAVYALGLGIPFLAAAFAFNTFLARSRAMRRFLRPLQIITGSLLVVLGLMLATGRFRLLTAILAGYGQLFSIGS
jgi:cytochrome c-type biogenesis protein